MVECAINSIPSKRELSESKREVVNGMIEFF